MQFGQDVCHAHQVGQVFVARKALLTLVGFLGELIGFLDQGFVEGSFGRGRRFF